MSHRIWLANHIRLVLRTLPYEINDAIERVLDFLGLLVKEWKEIKTSLGSCVKIPVYYIPLIDSRVIGLTAYKTDNYGNIWKLFARSSFDIYRNILGGACSFPYKLSRTHLYNRRQQVYNDMPVYVLDAPGGKDCLMFRAKETDAFIDSGYNCVVIENGKLFVVNNIRQELYGYDRKKNKMIKLKYTPMSTAPFEYVRDDIVRTIDYKDPEHKGKSREMSYHFSFTWIGDRYMLANIKILRKLALVVEIDIPIPDVSNLLIYDKNLVVMDKENGTYMLVNLHDVIRQMLTRRRKPKSKLKSKLQDEFGVTQSTLTLHD